MIINILLDILVYIFSSLNFKKSYLIILGSDFGKKFNGNTKYLFLYLSKETKLENFYFITKNKKLFKELTDLGYNVLYQYSLKAFFSLIKAKYYIIEKTTKDVLYQGLISSKKIRIIQLFHGTPLKKIGNDAIIENKGIVKKNTLKIKMLNNISSKIRNILRKKIYYQNYFAIISCSEIAKNSFKTAFNNNNILTIGYPRNDVFFNNNLIYNDYKTQFHLNSYRKIILYVPTFRDLKDKVNPFSDVFLTKLNLYLVESNFILIIKKHPFQNIIEIPDKISNIKDYSNEIDDIQDMLIYTDILITDYSSVFFDFILTDRPIIFYSYDFDDYINNCRGMYYNYYSDMIGPFAKNENELLELLKTVNIWFNSDEYQIKYNKFKKYFNKYIDGNSSQRFIEYIYSNIK